MIRGLGLIGIAIYYCDYFSNDEDKDKIVKSANGLSGNFSSIFCTP
jgi:hypothetical protein